MQIEDISGRLVRVHTTSKIAIVQKKTAKALADVKRARTLLDKAKQTLFWAEYTDSRGEIVPR